MNEVTVAIPTLGRPSRVLEVARAFMQDGVDILFLPDEDDVQTMQVLKQARLPYSIAHVAQKFGVPTYETKINHAYSITDTPYLLYASDDVEPQMGWLSNALTILNADLSVGLLATNDESHHLVRAGKLATHGIVRRSYVQQHGTASHPDSGPVFHEGYRHWGCDAEASYVARIRGAFRYGDKVRVTHVRRKMVRRSGGIDKTYQIGNAHADSDRALLAERCPGWPEIPNSSAPD
jgi:hypothetical protein